MAMLKYHPPPPSTPPPPRTVLGMSGDLNLNGVTWLPSMFLFGPKGLGRNFQASLQHHEHLDSRLGRARLLCKSQFLAVLSPSCRTQAVATGFPAPQHWVTRRPDLLVESTQWHLGAAEKACLSEPGTGPHAQQWSIN